MTPQHFIAGLFLSATAILAVALPADREQPIRIQSDFGESDQNTGVSTYRGNVRIIQGSLRINADEVILEVENDQASMITATGVPATMRQRPNPDDAIVQASAATIRYNVAEELLSLEGNARVVQDETSVSGERIEYFMRERRFQALGDETKQEQGSRVQIVLPAKQVDAKINNADKDRGADDTEVKRKPATPTVENDNDDDDAGDAQVDAAPAGPQADPTATTN